jgi:hypothetical protein
MSTAKVREALARLRGWGDVDVADAAESEVEAIEKAARALVAWNEKGRPATDLDAARGYGVMERIAREAGEPITADGGTSGDPKANG